ncbi:DUF4139 domain-containing protein [uncultured Thiohalocapsa sp.]|uniref:DUF4139 domain-containing protein n=1 Tax=uncultured Thiohalocapsa sp. TaxID=768990 RepID=UPI0025E2251C|nr:DUF4139 domain-containing protein [uncultured Thiohalocapsa sp.]
MHTRLGIRAALLAALTLIGTETTMAQPPQAPPPQPPVYPPASMAGTAESESGRKDAGEVGADLAAGVPEQRSTLAEQTAVAVTIYNQDLALIKDRRRLTLPAGRLDLAFRDVSARIRPETALLRDTAGAAGVTVLEQNFDFDLLTPDKLLEKYVGREVGVVRTHPTTGEETEETATVLAASDGVVLRIGSGAEQRIEASRNGVLPGRIVYRDIPPNLRDRPTLVLALDNAAAGERELELSYLSGGLSWEADYVGELAPDETSLDLTGWVTLTNQSGTAYRDAKLQLVAGEVNIADEPQADMMMMEAMPRAAAAPPMREESLFEYHLYTLQRPTTIADNQTKQVSLLDAPGVTVGKELLVRGNPGSYRGARGRLTEEMDVSVFLELTNDETSNLGMPLPAGTVRIYKRDAAGNAQFVGEDRIDHTPKNETVRLKLGESFDVTAERKQTAFDKRSGTGPWQYEFDSAYEIRIRNAKPEPQPVTVQERIPGDWKMLEESAPHAVGNANTAVWKLTVPAEGETVLTYRVRVRF